MMNVMQWREATPEEIQAINNPESGWKLYGGYSICPVCYYDELDEPPERFSICPSCGTEFEYDDSPVWFDNMSQADVHALLRGIWINNGSKYWFIEEI